MRGERGKSPLPRPNLRGKKESLSSREKMGRRVWFLDRSKLPQGVAMEELIIGKTARRLSVSTLAEELAVGKGVEERSPKDFGKGGHQLKKKNCCQEVGGGGRRERISDLETGPEPGVGVGNTQNLFGGLHSEREAKPRSNVRKSP